MISASTLDAAVSAVTPKPQIMPSGVRRWIPAAVPKVNGSPVTAEFIQSMADHLNAESVSIPIDGGEPGSVTHETAADVATGWVHRAAVIDGALYLEAEVLPHIAAAIEEGRLAYSSIDAVYEIDEGGDLVPSSARLITHGLTNTPKDRDMPPIQSVKMRVVNAFTRARLAGEDMSKKKIEEPAPVETVTQAEPAAVEAAAPPADMPVEPGSGPMSLEEAMAKIAELEAQLAAAQAAGAEMSARLEAETASQPSAEQMREAACVAVVDEAIKAGRIGRDSRDKWLKVARQSVDAAKSALASIPARVQRITQASENAPKSDTSTGMTEDEQHLARLLRTGGVSEQVIQQKIAQKRAQKVV